MEINGVTLLGWCSPKKAAFLQDWITNNKTANILEIGVFGGASLIPMAMAAAKHGGKAYGIDPWDRDVCTEAMVNPENLKWWNTVRLGEVKRSYYNAITKLNITNIETLEGTSEDFKDNFPDEHFGVLSIDGNHGLPCLRDAMWYLKKVQKGGLLACDDEAWQEGGIFTVQRMIAWLLENGCSYNCSIDGCAMLIKD